MTERDGMLIALVKEVLGPRNGSLEVLPEEQDPRNEFITGVLQPVNAPRINEIEDDVDEVIEETSSDEDQDNQGFVSAPGVFSPALDPKSLPRSIGLSFTVTSQSGTTPEIEVCATWARYYLLTDGWHRTPSHFLTGVFPVNRPSKEWSAGSGVKLQMRSKELEPGVWRISLFLINVTSMEKPDFPQTFEYLFQPQIRVHCQEDTRLLPVRLSGSSEAIEIQPGSMAEEDLSLGLLYLNRTALARGHMCGATWKEIDPERLTPDFSHPEFSPFYWTDKEIVPPDEQSKFTPADVRTEMVPCYPIQTPGMLWDPQFGPLPELRPSVLAETWQPEQLRNSLISLVEGYRRWIEQQQDRIDALPQPYQIAAQNNLQKCLQVADRMAQAVNILTSDENEDVRLAFCFANKAIALQASWKGQTLTWRPFQLAFILLNIPALSDRFHPDRQICDLLWFPTGGGKTEAYLGLSAFVLALRRLQARQNELDQDRTGAGTGVLSRYTLRLLTIQQFRRALGVITACEVLRVQNLDQPGAAVGWRPQEYPRKQDFLWGGIRFSAGLWVGGGVTPNSLLSIGPFPSPVDRTMTMYAGALDILKGISKDYKGPDQSLQRVAQIVRHLEAEGEPAQVMNCPCCRSILSVPKEGLGPGRHILHFVYEGGTAITPALPYLRPSITAVTINNANIANHNNGGHHTLSIDFTIAPQSNFKDQQIDEWWNNTLIRALGNNVRLMAARAARPGYFILTYDNSRNSTKQCNFNIFCPNPDCALNQSAWAEQVPLPRDITSSNAQPLSQGMLGFAGTGQTNRLPVVAIDRLNWQIVPSSFRWDESETGQRISSRIPIPAYTVDDQIYHHCPSLVIATVDKFARLAFEPKASALFGNVSHYHSRWGYYREGCPPDHDGGLPTTFTPHPPGKSRNDTLRTEVYPFFPPDLILQDELHLIEGPLGSLVGLYETAIDLLCQRKIDDQTIYPKYIASTATVRQAETQVQALFNRRLTQFPPSALSADDRFFATDKEIHPLDNSKPGRLYVAVCAPGKGAQTPIVRIWSGLLQAAWELSGGIPGTNIDPFWTLVGYFNATRELAGALSLFRQDIPERMGNLYHNPRPLDDEHRKIELSSRANSLNLPSLLQRMEIQTPAALDAVFATSMFGTGVDIDRLSLMVVHGQPKTTAAYIQATGRVGRLTGGLVISFFRATRPRDLDHYEFFTGYHRALYRQVEPITVAPFSPRARERALGPLAVVMLRQSEEIADIPVHEDWRIQKRISGGFHARANRMKDHRHDPEVTCIPQLFEERARSQPIGRRPQPDTTRIETASELDRWQSIAHQNDGPDELLYSEPALLRDPSHPVVLGDAQHRNRFDEAYENAPQSLRDIEETTGFRD